MLITSEEEMIGAGDGSSDFVKSESFIKLEEKWSQLQSEVYDLRKVLGAQWDSDSASFRKQALANPDQHVAITTEADLLSYICCPHNWTLD